MPLMSKSRPADHSIASMAASENPSSKENKGSRFRVSDTSGNVTAGGPGSGRKKEIEDYLKSMGFIKHKVMHKSAQENGDTADGSSHWYKETSRNPHGTHMDTGSTSHGVMVTSDGTWFHSVTGGNKGESLDTLKAIPMAASAGVSGNTLDSLKRILAKELKSTKKMKASKSKGFTVKCATGEMTIHSGGPGSGRHITVTTGNKPELDKMHKSLTNKGFSKKVSFGTNGDSTHEYSHSNGDKVTMHYVPSRATPAYSKGKEAGEKLGHFLKQALEERMSKAIQIAK